MLTTHFLQHNHLLRSKYMTIIRLSNRNFRNGEFAYRVYISCIFVRSHKLRKINELISLLCHLVPVSVAARLRRRSTAARLLRLWVRIPPGAWMFVCCEYCVLLGRGLCDELITRPGESYRLCLVVVCDQETS